MMIQSNDSVSSIAGSDSNDLTSIMAKEMEELCRISPICRLPAEIMIAIFAKLPKPSDLASCMLVSRSWAQNCVGLLWHRPFTAEWTSLQRVVQTLSTSPRTTFNYPYFIKRLNLSTLANQASDGVLAPFKDCKRIERLTLTGCHMLSDYSVEKVIQGNTSLLALDVTRINNLTDKTILAVAQNCYRLQGLNISDCRQISNEALEQVAYSCRNLKRVSLIVFDLLHKLTLVAQIQWM
jgi:F-box and leucine-rich repeat protein GRR1